MRNLLLIILIFSFSPVRSQNCIPNTIDSLSFEESFSAISQCKTDAPFSYYAKMGDLYYANGQNTKAIISYENARLFNSAHGLVNQNLSACYSNTDNAVKELIINDLKSKRHIFFNPKLANIWTIISLCLWLCFIFSILRIFGFKKTLHRGFLAIGVLAFVFSVLTYFSLESAPIGIVTKDDTGGKEFSSETAENQSVLNRGYKLEILEYGLDWCKVKLATNKICWVQTGSLEIVDNQ